jgi:rhodanese-related sulfurtransferase
MHARTVEERLPAPRIALFLAFLALLSGCSGAKKVDERDISKISTGELQRLVAQASAEDGVLILLDARSEAAFREAHLPGARNLRPAQVDPELGKDPAISRHDHIITYGEHPNSPVAKALTKRLLSTRYKGVRLYDGGVRSWKNAGLPVFSSED